jgi:hypothetical protein
VTAEKDPFDLWWEWINDGNLNGFQIIPARIRDAVLMLTSEERKDRAIVNETVRTRRSARQGARIGMGCRKRRNKKEAANLFAAL